MYTSQCSNAFHSVAAVVNYIVKLCPDRVTHLKMQKLLYYIQGYSLALLKKPMFDEDIEAWEYGPVVGELYPKLRKFGSNPISGTLEASDSIDGQGRAAGLILAVLRTFLPFSAGQLVDMTHQTDSPWDQTYKSGAGKFCKIPLWMMMAYFTDRVEQRKQADNDGE